MQSDPADLSALYFLSWLDSIERLDTLLLEARHLQQNIVYLLRAPALYRPLRYEEDLLWDWKGWEILSDTRLTWDLARDLARCWVPPYPEIGSTPEDVRKKIDHLFEATALVHADIALIQARARSVSETVREGVNGLASRGRWSQDQKAHYYNLLAIQEIKRHIVRDKIILCWEGLRLFVYPSEGSTPVDQGHWTNFSRFLVLRTAVQARARSYVARLGDHLFLFTHSQDYGLHDHPRPSVERRRDQHMYSSHLRDRCRNIAIEMSLLMGKLMGGEPAAPYPLVFHRWQHDFTSRSYSFENEFEPSNARSTEVGSVPANRYQHYVDTSFWMPERPDLQSVIAHEVAHGVLRERLRDLLPQKLDLDHGSLARLLKELHQSLAVFLSDFGEEDNAMHWLREIAVDLLATAIEGPAYVYALFLEIVGVGIEDMFAVAVSPDRFELEMIDYLEGPPAAYAQMCDWYVRLHLVSTWLETISPIERKDDHPSLVLQKRLLVAIRGALESLLEFLDQNAPPDKPTGPFWCALKDRLCAILTGSRAARQAKEWLRDREKDHSVKSLI